MSYQKPLLSGLATGDPVTYPIYYDQETTTYDIAGCGCFFEEDERITEVATDLGIEGEK